MRKGTPDCGRPTWVLGSQLADIQMALRAKFLLFLHLLGGCFLPYKVGSHSQDVVGKQGTPFSSFRVS